MDDGQAVSQVEKGARFVSLHAGPDLLLLPNAWDVASALLLQRAGFSAIATTSAGIGYSLGYPVGESIPRGEMLRAVERMASRLEVPLSADMEAGFGAGPEAIAETVRLTIQAGAVGINIEDSTYCEGQLVEMGLAAECIQAAREAADATNIPFVVNALAMCTGQNGRDARLLMKQCGGCRPIAPPAPIACFSLASRIGRLYRRFYPPSTPRLI